MRWNDEEGRQKYTGEVKEIKVEGKKGVDKIFRGHREVERRE